MISYMCGYLRYYYPTEFCTSFLNCAKNDDDIANGTYLAQYKGCKIETPLFRFSTSEYGCNAETKTIYKGIGSIKDVSKACGDNLYTLKDNQYDTFIDLLYDIFDNKLANKTDIKKLTKIDFFREFGDINYLLQVEDLFQLLRKRSTFKLSDCEQYGVTLEEVSSVSEKVTAKQCSGVNMKELLKIISNKLEYKTTTNIEHIGYELNVLGYTNYTDNTVDENLYVVAVVDENKYGTRFATIYNPNYGEYSQYKVNRKNFEEHPMEVGDIMRVVIREQYKKKKVDNKWVDSDETEFIIKDYIIVKRMGGV